MLEVKLERIPYGVSEKKILNPTLKMLEFALFNAGFENGTWILKSPHRTRKKNAERFRAMRLEGAGIRIRTKPGGNDTCYEWTIFPPQGMDQDLVFSDLSSLHPTSMKSTRSLATSRDHEIMGGLFDRIVDSKPGLLPDTVVAKKHEISLNDLRDPQAEVDDFANLVESVENIEVGSVAETVAPEIHRIASLDLSDVGESLSSDFSMDRALIAFRIAGNGADFVRRTILTDRFIRLLNINDLIKKSPVYGSVRGAMRALLMSCCSKGYMERIMYGENSTNGYRLTEDGKRRLEFLDGCVEEDLKAKMTQSKIPPQEGSQPVIQEPPPASVKDVGDAISILKGLIGEHEAVKKQMEELQQMVNELEGEFENDDLMLIGIENSLNSKIGEKDALDVEIKRLESKLASLKEKSGKKAADMKFLKDEMEKLSAKKAEIESKLTR